MTTDNSKREKLIEFFMEDEMKNKNLSNDSLKPIEPDMDYVSMMQKFKEILNNKNSDWTLQISVINYLRRILKFEKKIFIQFFYGAKLYEKIIALMDSVRSSLSKNVLILLNEIFSSPISEQDKNDTSIISLIKATLPHLIPKINSNQCFIKADSKICLESIVNNMKYFDVLLTFMQLMNTHKLKDSELCAEFSTKMIKNLGKEFFTQNPRFNELIKCIVSFYEAQKNTNVKICKNILNCFVEILGKEDFNQKIEKCPKKEKDDVKIILNTKVAEVKKKSGTNSSVHFRKVINEKRKSFRMSKLNENKDNKSMTKPGTIKLIPKGKESMVFVSKTLKLNDENEVKNN